MRNKFSRSHLFCIVSCLLVSLCGCPDVINMAPANDDNTMNDNSSNQDNNDSSRPNTDDFEVNIVLAGDGDVTESREGELVTLSAVTPEGWRFVAWENGLNSSVNPVTFRITDSISVVAHFEEIIFDDDNDGVADENDLCSRTRPGDPVDFDGCACNQLDEDDDGINNCFDNCPDSPTGAETNAAGCAEGETPAVIG